MRRRFLGLFWRTLTAPLHHPSYPPSIRHFDLPKRKQLWLLPSSDQSEAVCSSMSQWPLRPYVIRPRGDLLSCNKELDCSSTAPGLPPSLSTLFLKDDESLPRHLLPLCTLNAGFLCASQMQILDKFPIEGGQKDPKKRIIPFLPGDTGGQCAVFCFLVLLEPLWKLYLLLR